ncbi:hypothetical protein Tco_0539808 [Tanacetum coccineum]
MESCQQVASITWPLLLNARKQIVDRVSNEGSIAEKVIIKFIQRAIIDTKVSLPKETNNGSGLKLKGSKQSHIKVHFKGIIAKVQYQRLLEGDHKQEEDKKDKIVVSKVKSHEVEFIGTTYESHLLNLPFEVLEMIIESCVGVEYMNFRASCKLCYLAVPIIQWSNQTASKRLHFDFSAPPTSLDCMVVQFTSLCKCHVHIHFVGRESSWHQYALSSGNNDPDLFRFPAFYGGDVYALCYGKGVDFFKGLGIEDHNWEWKRVLDEVLISSCTSKAQHFLVKCDQGYKCDQHLILVIVGEFGESVELFIPNEDAGKWDKIDDIRRHMIYIGDKTYLCMEAKTPKMENKIYFPRFHSEKVVFYSLATRKFHTNNGGNISKSLTDFFGTINHLPHNAWIEPAWS